MGELVFAILVTAGNRSRLLSGFYRQRVDIDRIFQRVSSLSETFPAHRVLQLTERALQRQVGARPPAAQVRECVGASGRLDA